MDLQLPTRTYERFFDCVHCGLCLPNCPTYAQLGDENDSPRGRVYLMRKLAEKQLEPTDRVVRHLDRCLDCRACETACPSGVRYGSLIEATKAVLQARRPHAPRRLADRLLDHFMYHVIPDRRRLIRWMTAARLAEESGLRAFLGQSGLLACLPGPLARLEGLLPGAGAAGRPDEMPTHHGPAGRPRAKVALFLGCVGEAVFPHTNRATLRVLLANECEVFCPSQQVCCGAIHHHAGRSDQARSLARRNVEVFAGLAQAVGGFDALVTNVAGCGAMLKQLPELLNGDQAYARPAERFADKVRDISEFLVGLPMKAPRGGRPEKLTYHDPCHLAHAQRIRRQPRDLLRSIPGLELVEMPESDFCCGAAGTYNLTQPELADGLARRKLANVDRLGGVETIATGNAGCLLQLMQHVRDTLRPYRVVHPIDLLDEAYGHRC